MSSTNDVLRRIDATLGTVTGDSIGADAMRWQPAAYRYTCAALLVPAHLAEPIRLVDLGSDKHAAVQNLIGCRLIQKITVDGAGAVSTEFLCDEEDGPDSNADAILNKRATELAHVLKFAQFTGEYPAPADLSPPELAFDAVMWRKAIRLFGPVVIVGADERTRGWVPVPQRLIEFVTEMLDVDLNPGVPQQTMSPSA